MRAHLVMLISVLGLSNLTGCAALYKMSHRWEGKSIDDVVASKGPPSSSYQLSNGNTVYKYVTGRNSTVEGKTKWATNERYATVNETECAYLLEASPSGVIVKQTNPSGCN